MGSPPVFLSGKGVTMKTGLIMEGGAMRGMFTAGVTDVMMEHGITFDGAVGVSAGAVFGCNFKSRQPGRVIRYNAAYCNNPHYAGIYMLLKTGDLFGEQFCYHDIPDRLDPFDFKAYRENPMAFYVTATDINTGGPVYERVDVCDERGMKWMKASASLPLVSKIVCVDGYELLDGGIADSVPVRFMERQGYDRNVAILTRPLQYVKHHNPVMPLARIVLKDYPNMIDAMEHRHENYNRSIRDIRRREEKGELFVIRPPKPIEVDPIEHNRTRLLKAYQMGRNTMEGQIPGLLKYLHVS